MSSKIDTLHPLLVENAEVTNVAIRVQNLSKCYQIYDNPHDRLKQFIIPRLQRMVRQLPRQYFQEFWALKNISFEIEKGETIGIIGRNGSGKSTLLQLICGTLSSSKGAIQTNGRIAALLELGSGFNPEFTGRENVYMSCALLGLSMEETDAKFDEISAFADIGEFMEQPIKTYSSGMFVRLAFAVNIVSDPDIMIVDEALAVGDMNFRARCMTALAHIQNKGTTIIIVSHDIGMIKSFCTKAIYLEKGILQTIGRASDVAERYIGIMRGEMNAEQRKFIRLAQGFVEEDVKEMENVEPLLKNNDLLLKRSDEFDKRVAIFRYGSGGAKITYVELLDTNNQAIQTVEFNQEVQIRIFCVVEVAMQLFVNFQISDDRRNIVTGSSFKMSGETFLPAKEGACYAATYSLRLPLRSGVYSIQANIVKSMPEHLRAEYIDVVPDSFVFEILAGEPSKIWSAVYLFPKLEIEKAEQC